MFLSKTAQCNAPLVECALALAGSGRLQPDTYLLDLDTIEANAAAIQAAGRAAGVENYFMLKQLGRNPAVARLLVDAGWKGPVCVDWREALTLLRAGIRPGHVGHLVQTPRVVIDEILAEKPDIVTVYTLEKAAEWNEAAKRLGWRQDVMLRVAAGPDIVYPGQAGGVPLAQVQQFALQLRGFDHLNLAGVTGFPCFLYDEAKGDICHTPNANTVAKAAELLRDGMGLPITQVNLPSSSCAHSMQKIAAAGGNYGEPGHALSGTTPYHAAHTAAEKPALVYLSEISHNMGGRAYCYGGGWYRRGHVRAALVGKSLESARWLEVTPPADENIDYTFALEAECPVSTPVVMAFRTQIFVTRSQVALVRGIQSGTPRVEGIYSAQGELLRGA